MQSLILLKLAPEESKTITFQKIRKISSSNQGKLTETFESIGLYKKKKIFFLFMTMENIWQNILSTNALGEIEKQDINVIYFSYDSPMNRNTFNEL